MGAITGQTNDNINFSIKRIRVEVLEIPVDQEMIVSKKIKIDEPGTISINQDACLTILGDT